MAELLIVAGGGLLLVTWVAFPAVLVVAARLFARRGGTSASKGETLPSVTVVLATRDDETVIMGRVRNLLDQDYPTEFLDVIVALDHSVADRLEITKRTVASARVRVVVGDPPAGKPGALNAGVREAKGELLLFADARQRFGRDAARRLVSRLLLDGRAGAVSGSVARPDGTSALVALYARYDQAIREAESELSSSVGVMGAIYCMRRALWRPLPRDLILDDLWVPMRLVLDGWRVLVESGAVAYESRSADGVVEARRKERTLTGNYQLMRMMPDVLVPGRNPVWLVFVLHKVLRLLTPIALLVFLSGVLFVLVHHVRAFGASVVVGAGALVGIGLASARLRSTLGDFARMQKAAMLAMYNGIIGRWQVW